MERTSLRIALLAPAALLAAACASKSPVEPAPPGPVVAAVDAGEQFTLRIGQRATVDGELTLHFLTVRDDSRCPVDVTCVWAGDAVVVLQAWTGERAGEILRLHVNEEPRAARHERWTVRLVELAPAPSSEDPIEPGEYVATLTVED